MAEVLECPDDNAVLAITYKALDDLVKTHPSTLNEHQRTALSVLEFDNDMSAGRFLELLAGRDVRGRTGGVNIDTLNETLRALGAHDSANALAQGETALRGPARTKRLHLSILESLVDLPRIRSLVVDYIRANEASFLELPVAPGFEIPDSPPLKPGSFAELAAWANSNGGFATYEQLPNNTTVKLIQIPGSRRDLDEILAFIAAAAPSSLTSLEIPDGHHLTQNGVDSIANIQSLKSLSLEGCKSVDFSPLENLTRLDLRVRSRYFEKENLEQLQRVDLRSLMLILAPIDEIALPAECERLHVASLSSLRAVSFHGPISTKELTLDNVILSQQAWDSICSAESLVSLTMWRTVGLDADRLSELSHTRLESLDININDLQISRDVVEHLIRMKSLRTLYLDHYKLDAILARRLREGLPDCDIALSVE